MSAVLKKEQAIDNLPVTDEEGWKYTNLGAAVRKLDIHESAGPAIRAEGPVESVQKLTDGQGWRVDVPQGQVLTAPIKIFIGAVAEKITAPVLSIRLAAQAQATIVEYHTGEGRFLNNARTDIVLDAGARLNHYRVQAYGAAGVYVQTTQVSLARDATYDAFTLTTGAALSRNQITARIDGPGAHCELNGVNLLRGEQHGDTTILVDHQAPNCASHQFYRSVIDDRARGVFQGKIHVARAAQKTDGFQMSRALILSEGAEMDTKPELEIYADDVKCSHGATTGQLDEEALFYMRSRGLSMAEARGLLIGAFVNEAIDKISDESIRQEFAERVRAWQGN